jgi:hypothetical protein
MADIDPAIVNAMNEAFNRGQISATTLSQSLSAMQSSVNSSTRSASNMAKTFENASQSSKQLGVAAAQGSAYFRSAYRDVKALSSSAEEAREQFERIKNSIVSQIADPRMQASVKRFADAQADAADRTEALTRAATSLGKPLSYVGGVATSLISSYQGGSSQIGTATAAMEIALSSAGNILKGFGNAAQVAGAVLSEIPLVGAGLEVLGLATKAAGKVLDDVAKTILPMLNKQLEINISAFQGLSSSGAVFTGGLQSMINNAGNAGLTLQQLDIVVKTNKESLASLGEGVSGGTNRLVKVFQAGGDDLKKRMWNLGYNVEEQAGLIADVMKDMRQSGRIIPDNPQNNASIAEATKNYAENLRVISNITGEDAKAKMQQARSAANELAFQQKLEGMDATQRQNIVNAMANMSPVLQKAFQETVVFGRAVTPAVAGFLAQSQDAQNSLDASVSKMQNNQLDQGTQLDINKKYGEGIRQDMLNSTDIAMAGLAGVGGIVGQLKDIMQQELAFRQHYTGESIDRARQSAAGQARPEEVRNAQGELVNQAQIEMVNLLNANQGLNAEISKFASSTKLLEYYAKGAAFAAGTLRDGLAHLNAWLNAPSNATPAERSLAARQSSEESRDREEGAEINQRINPVPGTYPPGRGPGTPGFVPIPGDLSGTQLDRLLRQQQGATPNSATPSSTTLPNGPQGANDLNNPNNARRASSLYFNGTPMPNGDQLARQQEQPARPENQNPIEPTQQNNDRTRNASLLENSTSMERLTTAMNSVRDILDDSVRHLSNIENNTRQAVQNAL